MPVGADLFHSHRFQGRLLPSSTLLPNSINLLQESVRRVFLSQPARLPQNRLEAVEDTWSLFPSVRPRLSGNLMNAPR